MMAPSLIQPQPISDDSLRSEFPFMRHGGSKGDGALGPSHAQTVNPHSPADRPSRFPSEVFEDLTRKETQDVLEILHYSITATTEENVFHVLGLLKELVACPRVIGGVAQLTAKGGFKSFSSVINVSYSNDWLYAYCKNEYATVDPVLQSLLSTLKTQTWEQTYSTAGTRKQLEFIEEARSFGLTHGITTGILDQSRDFATFYSFAGGDSKNTRRYVGLLEYLLPSLHRILIANTNVPISSLIKGLSPREMTVLSWMKEGKTNWEIARIVGVTERTVRFHVESIFTKLDASSRTQAVAVAMQHGLLQAK